MSLEHKEGKSILKVPKKIKPISKSENYLKNKKDVTADENSENLQSPSQTSVESETDAEYAWNEMTRGKSIPLVVYPNDIQDNEYFCSALVARKWVITGLILQFLCFLADLVLWYYIYFKLPMGFAGEFQNTQLQFTTNRYFLITCGIEPLYNLIFLVIAICLAKKKKCFLRMYYLISPWLLLLIVFIGFHALFFVGRLTKKELHDELYDSMIMYDSWEWSQEDREHLGISHEASMHAWDNLQNHFQCCGIDQYTDWKINVRNFLEDDQTKEWRAPHSCCVLLRSGARLNCTTMPNKMNTWKTGCLDHAFDLFSLIGYIIVGLVIAIVVVSIFCIFAAAEFYSSLRRGDQTNYVMNFKIYCYECCCFGCICFKWCCCCCCCKCGKKNKIQIQPESPEVEVSKVKTEASKKTLTVTTNEIQTQDK